MIPAKTAIAQNRFIEGERQGYDSGLETRKVREVCFPRHLDDDRSELLRTDHPASFGFPVLPAIPARHAFDGGIGTAIFGKDPSVLFAEAAHTPGIAEPHAHRVAFPVDGASGLFLGNEGSLALHRPAGVVCHDRLVRVSILFDLGIDPCVGVAGKDDPLPAVLAANHGPVFEFHGCKQRRTHNEFRRAVAVAHNASAVGAQPVTGWPPKAVLDQPLFALHDFTVPSAFRIQCQIHHHRRHPVTACYDGEHVALQFFGFVDSQIIPGQVPKLVPSCLGCPALVEPALGTSANSAELFLRPRCPVEIQEFPGQPAQFSIAEIVEVIDTLERLHAVAAIGHFDQQPLFRPLNQPRLAIRRPRPVVLWRRGSIIVGAVPVRRLVLEEF